jgi:hypothetical protein
VALNLSADLLLAQGVVATETFFDLYIILAISGNYLGIGSFESKTG